MLEAAALVAGGLAAGIVNTLAGGGSFLTVPLLVMLGLPGTVANGTNRVGVVLQSAMAALRFRAEGVSGIGSAVPVVIPVVLGSWIGASLISRVSDTAFERGFGVVMLLLLVPTLRPPRLRGREPGGGEPGPPSRRSAWTRHALFFAIGLYGGAFQAGVGILIVLALAFAGYDLVRANSIKVVVNFCLAGIALPVFVIAGQVAWLPAVLLGSGFAAGGERGARLAVRGGERRVRPGLAGAGVARAGRRRGGY